MVTIKIIKLSAMNLTSSYIHYSLFIHLFKHPFFHKTFMNSELCWAQWGSYQEIESRIPEFKKLNYELKTINQRGVEL